MTALTVKELDLKSKAVDARVARSFKAVYSELLGLGNYFLKLKEELKGDYKKVIQGCEHVSYDASVRYCNFAKHPDTLKALVSGLGKVDSGRLSTKALNTAVTEVAKGKQTVEAVVEKVKAVKDRAVKPADLKEVTVANRRTDNDVTEDYAMEVAKEAARNTFLYKDVKELREDFEDDDDLLRELNYALKEKAFYEAEADYLTKHLVFADAPEDRSYVAPAYFDFLLKELGVSEEQLATLSDRYSKKVVAEITASLFN